MQINNTSNLSFGRLKAESSKALLKLEANIEKLPKTDKEFAKTALSVVREMKDHDLFVSNKGRLTIISNTNESKGEKTEMGKNILNALKEIIHDDRRSGIFERLKARLEKRPQAEIDEMDFNRELLYEPLLKYESYLYN